MSNADEADKDNWRNIIAIDGEAVVLTKHVGGAIRNISAIINRSPPAKTDPSGRVTKPQMTALVSNDATAGYSLSEMDNRDTITVAYRIGGTAKPYSIRLSETEGAQDAATLLLELD
jgi:hypothetical protein